MINGKLIKNHRKTLHISQKELAEGITTQGTISALERNSTSPSSEILAKILDRLSLTLDEVLVGNDKIDTQRWLNQADQEFMKYCYQAVLDTLKNIKEIEDSKQKAHFLFLKTNAEMWLKKNYDDAIFGYNQLLQESPNKDNIYATLAICELGVVYELKQDLKKSAFYFNQLPTLINKIDIDKNIFWTLMLFDNLSKYYSNIEQHDKCLKILDQAIKLSKKHNAPMFVDSFYFLYATSLRDKNNKWTTECSEYMMKAWSFADFLNDSLVLSKAKEHLKNSLEKID